LFLYVGAPVSFSRVKRQSNKIREKLQKKKLIKRNNSLVGDSLNIIMDSKRHSLEELRKQLVIVDFSIIRKYIPAAAALKIESETKSTKNSELLEILFKEVTAG